MCQFKMIHIVLLWSLKPKWYKKDRTHVDNERGYLDLTLKFGEFNEDILLTYWCFLTNIKTTERWFGNVRFVVLYDFITALNGLKHGLPTMPKVVEWRKYLHEILICFQKLKSLFSSNCHCPMYENPFIHQSDDYNPDEIFWVYFEVVKAWPYLIHPPFFEKISSTSSTIKGL